MPHASETPASVVYSVAAEDRGARRSALRWIGGTVISLIDAGNDVPAVSDVVIRRVTDGEVVRRIEQGWRSDVDATMNDVLADLAETDRATFEAIWIDGEEDAR